MSENIGILLHKLTKYQTLIGGAPSNKRSLYQEKINEYSNKLNKMGIDNSNIQSMNVLFGGEEPEEKLAKLKDQLARNRANAGQRYAGLDAANKAAADKMAQQARELVKNTLECKEASKVLTAKNEELTKKSEELDAQIKKQEERLQKLAASVDDFAQLISGDSGSYSGDFEPPAPSYYDAFVNSYIEMTNDSNVDEMVAFIKNINTIKDLSQEEAIQFMKATLQRELSSNVALADKIMASFSNGKYATVAAAPSAEPPLRPKSVQIPSALGNTGQKSTGSSGLGNTDPKPTDTPDLGNTNQKPTDTPDLGNTNQKPTGSNNDGDDFSAEDD